MRKEVADAGVGCDDGRASTSPGAAELMPGFSAATGGLWDNHTGDDLSPTVPCQE